MGNGQRDVAKERFWRGVVKRQAASGLSVRAFCRRERLSEPSFYAWRRTLVERGGKNASPRKASSAVPARPATPAFVRAMIGSELWREEGLLIELRGGRVLRMPVSMPAERLAEIVQALEARGPR